jgi:hypothetical protein
VRYIIEVLYRSKWNRSKWKSQRFLFFLTELPHDLKVALLRVLEVVFYELAE